jgi:phage head maturation protease
MERGNGMAEEPLGLFFIEPALGFDPVVEGFAFDVGHAEENDIALLADVKNGHDIRMAQGRDRAGLLLEILDVIGIAGVFGPQDFDGDVAFQAPVPAP